MTNLEKLKYPIGQFEHQGEITAEQIAYWIKDIEGLPQQLRKAVQNLSEEQLELTYRPSGWTIRQVVHHIADSHLNSFVRFKLALTEDKPIVKTYFEDRWAELPDYYQVPVEIILSFIESLHRRWVVLLKALTPEDLVREFVHPESGLVRLDKNIGIYSWHGRHHLAHIKNALTKNRTND